MVKDFFEFENEKYPCRWIYFPKLGETNLVAAESLNEKIFVNDDYPSKEAEFIDRQIFFFIPDAMIDAPETDIAKFIEEDFSKCNYKFPDAEYMINGGKINGKEIGF